MPLRTDIGKILIIGSGPIVIGQACEFDYSGTQAAKVLKSLGYHVILVNSNPATIMTDPEIANETFIEPLTLESLEGIISLTKPQALLPTLGGQTALNLTLELHKSGILEELGVEILGAPIEAIKKAEDRKLFRETVASLGYPLSRSNVVTNIKEALHAAHVIGLPLILRPAFTLGGAGGAVVSSLPELKNKVEIALKESPIGQVLLEEALFGWKEFELEVMGDLRGNGVVVCTIENLDAMGVHTGDSITVAPIQTLTDREYQNLRDMALGIMQAVGIATGGANIQFAVNPKDGSVVVIEMNPRVSRSSALASKATGFPIAKIAAMLAVGMTLDEITNDITKVTPAAFEPVLDYTVVKIPRFAFEKFPDVSDLLTTTMKSVGEVMAVGRTFPEALQKAFRSLEQGYSGLDNTLRKEWSKNREKQAELLSVPTPPRLFYVKYALAGGMPAEEISGYTKIDPWFIREISKIAEYEKGLLKTGRLSEETLLEGKKLGFSDRQLADFLGIPEEDVRKRETPKTNYFAVDTCAGEFTAATPYFYSSYESGDDWAPLPGKKVLILGSGPNRIGQGIEFDYCSVEAVNALKELGYQGIMVNSNPETVSTDYDVASRLYFEPLVLENVLDIIDREKPFGVILQLGGQTPLKLARELERLHIPILGTSFDSIEATENRERFGKIVDDLGLLAPSFGMAGSLDEALEAAGHLGYPVLLRPSYVLSGHAMKIIYDEEGLKGHFHTAFVMGNEAPVLIDKFLEDAVEIDVDALSDGESTQILGIMEHIEEAGVHSGDSSCVIPTYSIRQPILDQIEEDVKLLAKELKIVGLLNVQFALRGNHLYCLEVNPRASRTIPYLSKARGIPFVRAAVQVMLGSTIKELPYDFSSPLSYYAVKIAVLPWKRLFGRDAVLGPEMKSTGEVMGIASTLGEAFLKGMLASGMKLPRRGTIFISVKDEDKRAIVSLARKFISLGYKLVATKGTAETLAKSGIAVEWVKKVQEGTPNIVDFICKGDIQLVINTPSGPDRKKAGADIRLASIANDVPLVTTLSGAHATLMAIEAMRRPGEPFTTPLSLQSITKSHETILTRDLVSGIKATI